MFSNTLESTKLILIFVSRKRADDVLENAKNVVQALEEADTAQTKAKEAINKAKEDISLADDDLGQVHKSFNCQLI